MSLDKIAIVDIETTGPNSLDGDRIIQIAAVIVENGVITARHSMLINPEINIPPQIVQLTGITQEKVAKAPTFQQVVGLWYQRLKDCFFVAHNLAFDLTFLRNYFYEFGKYEFNPEGFDTVKLAKIFLPEATGFNLTDLANYLRLPFENAHDALADAEITAYILHEIATRADNLPFATRIELMPYLNQLANQEKYMLKYAKQFLLQTPPARIQSVSPSKDMPVLSQYTQKQAEYLLDLWRSNTHLVVEHQARPFTLEQQLALVTQLGKHSCPFLIMCHSEEQLMHVRRCLPADQIRILRTSDYYLHQKAFRELLLKVDVEQLTQLELITIAAIIYWQSYATDTNLAQLNAELLTINSILRKYVAEANQFSSHTSYHEAIKRVQQAHYLLTTMDSLPVLIERESLLERQLIVLDLGPVTHALHELATTYFSVSEWFTKFKLMGERIRFLSSSLKFEALLASGEQVNEAVHHLLMYTNDILKQSDLTMAELDLLDYCIPKTSSHHAKITDYLQKVMEAIQAFNSQMEQTKQIQLVLEEGDCRQIYQLCRHIREFANVSAASTYWNIYAQCLQEQYLNVRLSKCTFVLPPKYKQWLERHRRTLLLSNGNYGYLQSTGLFAQLDLDGFHYHLLPDTHFDQPITVQVPLSYIELPRESAQYIASIVSFIQDFKDELASHIVIFATNKQMLMQLYRACSSIEGYMVFAQGVSGSLRKVKRRAETEPRSIVIVQRHHVMESNWSLEGVATSVIVQTLPFVSFTSCKIQAIAGEVQEPSTQLFHSLLLPKMCRDFQQLVQYIHDYFHVTQVYLFDERVYTKYYSNEFRELVQTTINFEIME
ncbi:exonuclease domain-containing protein [Aerococcaceae bacterium NML190938]|nr:exonuclease domain-containing protein [Aerococcaceae bacterium NML190938]